MSGYCLAIFGKEEEGADVVNIGIEPREPMVETIVTSSGNLNQEDENRKMNNEKSQGVVNDITKMLQGILVMLDMKRA